MRSVLWLCIIILVLAGIPHPAASGGIPSVHPELMTGSPIPYIGGSIHAWIEHPHRIYVVADLDPDGHRILDTRLGPENVLSYVTYWDRATQQWHRLTSADDQVHVGNPLDRINHQVWEIGTVAVFSHVRKHIPNTNRLAGAVDLHTGEWLPYPTIPIT